MKVIHWQERTLGLSLLQLVQELPSAPRHRGPRHCALAWLSSGQVAGAADAAAAAAAAAAADRRSVEIVGIKVYVEKTVNF